MPSFPIVDTHVHLWDPEQIALPWTEGAPKLARPYGMADLDRQRGKVELAQIVFVECDVKPGASLAEARLVANLATKDPRIAAIVAHAPLEQGARVREHLDGLKEIPLVRGVRRLLQGEADDAYCLRPEFQEGLALLPEYGFAFELCIFHRQLPAVLQLVARHPDMRFVLDHIAKPGIAAGIIEPWWSLIGALARFPNVVCKLSGVATEADHVRWREAQVRAYMDRALDCFGPERIMFGGDWPVSTLAVDYVRWVEMVERATAHLNEAERRAIFVDNARQFYGLA